MRGSEGAWKIVGDLSQVVEVPERTQTSAPAVEYAGGEHAGAGAVEEEPVGTRETVDPRGERGGPRREAAPTKDLAVDRARAGRFAAGGDLREAHATSLDLRWDLVAFVGRAATELAGVVVAPGEDLPIFGEEHAVPVAEGDGAGVVRWAHHEHRAVDPAASTAILDEGIERQARDGLLQERQGAIDPARHRAIGPKDTATLRGQPLIVARRERGDGPDASLTARALAALPLAQLEEAPSVDDQQAAVASRRERRDPRCAPAAVLSRALDAVVTQRTDVRTEDDLRALGQVHSPHPGRVRFASHRREAPACPAPACVPNAANPAAGRKRVGDVPADARSVGREDAAERDEPERPDRRSDACMSARGCDRVGGEPRGDDRRGDVRRLVGEGARSSFHRRRARGEGHGEVHERQEEDRPPSQPFRGEPGSERQDDDRDEHYSRRAERSHFGPRHLAGHRLEDVATETRQPRGDQEERARRRSRHRTACTVRRAGTFRRAGAFVPVGIGRAEVPLACDGYNCY
jgi:hypothetical protein